MVGAPEKAADEDSYGNCFSSGSIRIFLSAWSGDHFYHHGGFFLLSRHLLRPIKKLADGTQALTARQFKTRIDVHTKDELGQLASGFNIMAQTLERYEQTQKQWLSDIAHELRTPLSILQGEIEAIQDGVREVNRKMFDSLHAEVLHVTKIVNDLHELSMADSGPFT
jgi:two-component system sensor histidine kinase BaeS